MDTGYFHKIFHVSKLILTEGALVERLKTEFNIQLDPHINHAAQIYENPVALEALYRQYIGIAQKHDLPIMLATPSRRVNEETLAISTYNDKDIIADSCEFLKSIRRSYTDYSSKIAIGGLLGCRGDAYSSDEALGKEEAYAFHSTQCEQFKDQHIDYLFAGIMPEINEATGMAMAMANTGLPYFISFMIRKDGCLIDGTPISTAIERIDNLVKPRPLYYMVNCIHPANLLSALEHHLNKNSHSIGRLKGIQANASTLSPEELNNCGVLHQDDFSSMVDKMHILYTAYDFKIFGGCCGTNDEFMDVLSREAGSW